MVMYFEMSRVYRDVMEETGRSLEADPDFDLKSIHDLKIRWSHHLTSRVEGRSHNVEETNMDNQSCSDSDEEVKGRNTQNFMICLYDKVVKNKLKFRTQFRQGFINIGNEDYVFSTGTGDLDW